MRKIILALVFIVAVAFLYFSFSEIEHVAETLKMGDVRFLLFAFLMALIWIYNMAVTLRSTYRLVGLEEDSRYLTLVVAAANFVNVIAPSIGIGGIAVFLDAAKQRSHSTGKVTVAGALFLLLDYLAFITVLALGWIVLIRRHNLTASEITASIILLAIALTMAFFVYLGYISGAKMGRALAWCARTINRVIRPFIRREYLQEQRAYHFANEFSEGMASIKGRKRKLIWPFLFSLNNKAILICILALSFLAFHVPFSTGTIVGGFSIGYLFVIVSPTPAGLGFVEGALPLALKSLRVRWEEAVLITLAYRAATFWFPLSVGGVAFRILQKRAKQGYLEPKA